MPKKVIHFNEEFKVKIRVYDIDSNLKELKDKLQKANLYYTVKKQDISHLFTVEVDIRNVGKISKIFRHY